MSEGASQEPTGSSSGSFRSVLVATDLSDDSDMLVEAAVEIASRSGAALHVVHSADVLSAEASGAHGTFEERVARGAAAMEQQISRVVPPTLAAGRHVGASAPHITILEQAEKVSADLIVLGPHVGRAAGLLLGTTAEQVLRGVRAPCLVVRAPLSIPPRHIAAAVDPRHLVGAVLDSAIQWALLLGGAGQPRLSALYISDERGERSHPELEEAVRDALDRRGATGRVDAAVEVRGTHVVESIVMYTEVESTDLLVLATHNRGMLGRALLGSVSAEVTRRVLCNVLLVPPGS